MDISLLIFLILIVVPCSTLIHEMGHALAARMVHADSIKLSIGRGKRLTRFSFEQIQITINVIYFLDGITVSSRAIPFNRKELICICCLGPILNGIIAFLLFATLNWVSNEYVQLLFWYNIWLGFANLIPIKYKDKHTDGYTLYKLIKEKHPPNIY
ncbi:hypothetical protein CWR48_08675 [Oceanobacillus arenosus]|uniref:Peptidase M50 domain-containing protein n=1 Tax=Oceanobacillus arenosus TaxID=1229153 RepID=A0A3D8PT03_9BACI|nr:M50 family metallopeptidase [Oceanobacillus arenosus]RDW19114.1 hypothetical protein CWR48_08675 [Oceanobacillus arenosus]